MPEARDVIADELPERYCGDCAPRDDRYDLLSLADHIIRSLKRAGYLIVNVKPNEA